MAIWPQMPSSTSGFVDRKIKFRTMRFIVLTLHLLKTLVILSLALNTCFPDLASHSPFPLQTLPLALICIHPIPHQFIHSTGWDAGCLCSPPAVGLLLLPLPWPAPFSSNRGDPGHTELSCTVMEGENKENWSVTTCINFFTSSYPYPS